MSQLGYKFNQLVKVTHKEGSFSTRSTRVKILNLAARQLQERGFKLRDPSGLKTKHINYLIDRWQSEGIAPKTIKNRLGVLRWVAEKISKPNIVARQNSDYKIPNVSSCPIGKSKALDLHKHSKITNEYVKLSLQLQQEFGLRREESIKFTLSYALRKDCIQLKGSWTKGGKPRQIPITNDAQRQLLKSIQSFNAGKSLIPGELNYKQQLKLYETQTSRVGLSKNHGLRHHYARQRYQELTGWQCPASGGPKRDTLAPRDKQIDYDARMQISQELGHERFNITYTYLGS